MPEERLDLDTFHFRDLHPHISLGTASDRYAGWIGQIYAPSKWKNQIIRRTRHLGGQKLTSEILPVASVREYFEHFSVLELDFTFYSLLLDEDGRPTHAYHLLAEYLRYSQFPSRKCSSANAFFLKVPQRIFARRMWKSGRYVENPDYLNSDLFVHCFYQPAVELLGPALRGFIFEQEYQKREDRLPIGRMVSELESFFMNLPRDSRYHVELRTSAFLVSPVFQVLEQFGIGQVLSHWTWLPRIRTQFSRSGEAFFNEGGNLLIRLLTPLGVRYEDAFKKAHPFTKLKEDMIDKDMIPDTVAVARKAVSKGIHINIIANNRAAGNAPLLIRRIAARLLQLDVH